MAALLMEPLQQPPAHRLKLTCDRHPDEKFTGFCTSCLRERLHSLESPSTSPNTHRNSISASLKSIFFNHPHLLFAPPDHRRCKSFSCGPGDGLSSTSFQPHRNSCSLFNQDIQIHTSRVVALSGAHCLAFSSTPAGIEVDGDVIEDTNHLRPMKDHVDLASQAKKPPPKDLKDIAGSFWLAASVFMHKWRRKQKKMKRHEGDLLQGSGRRSRRSPSTR